MENIHNIGKEVTVENYFFSTYGVWQLLEDPRSLIDPDNPDYTSDSGSCYWYIKYEGEDAVIRMADHWSTILLNNGEPCYPIARNIGQCFWALQTQLTNTNYVAIHDWYDSSSLVDGDGNSQPVFAIIKFNQFSWVENHDELETDRGSVYNDADQWSSNDASRVVAKIKRCNALKALQPLIDIIYEEKFDTRDIVPFLVEKLTYEYGIPAIQGNPYFIEKYDDLWTAYPQDTIYIILEGRYRTFIQFHHDIDHKIDSYSYPLE